MKTDEVNERWWQVGPMWLVVGGPTVVVIASFATLGLALYLPDPVVDQTVTAKASTASQLPAVKARNHAATAGR